MSKVELKGYCYADGTHWYYDGKEVAVIDETNNEIEWTVHKHLLLSEVVEAVRAKRHYPEGKWMVEVRKVDISASQGYYQVLVNDRELITFGADKKCDGGSWNFDIPNEDLGKLVVAAFWHKYDNIYHYSDKAKEMFYPKAEREGKI